MRQAYDSIFTHWPGASAGISMLETPTRAATLKIQGVFDDVLRACGFYPWTARPGTHNSRSEGLLPDGALIQITENTRGQAGGLSQIRKLFRCAQGLR